VKSAYSEVNGSRAVMIQNSSDTPVSISLPRFMEKHFYQLNSSIGKLFKVEDSKIDSNEPFRFLVQPYETTTLFAGVGSVGNISNGTIIQEEYQYRIKLRNNKWEFSPLTLNSFPLTRWSTRMSIDRATGLISNYYETSFEATGKEADAYLLFLDSKIRSDSSSSAIFKVLVNGQELIATTRTADEDSKMSFFDNDKNLLVFDIQEHLIRGKNSIRVMQNSVDKKLDILSYPPIVAIDAPVEQTPKGWSVHNPQDDQELFSWGGSGYPYLVGRAEYKITFEAPTTAKRVILQFDGLSGVAEIILNGEDVATIVSAPYRVDITNYLSRNRDELTVRVSNTSSPINALNCKESGILGDVYLEIFDDSMGADESKE
jgi:hypothetical protein